MNLHFTVLFVSALACTNACHHSKTDSSAGTLVTVPTPSQLAGGNHLIASTFGRETLEHIDLATGERRQLASPSPSCDGAGILGLVLLDSDGERRNVLVEQPALSGCGLWLTTPTHGSTSTSRWLADEPGWRADTLGPFHVGTPFSVVLRRTQSDDPVRWVRSGFASGGVTHMMATIQPERDVRVEWWHVPSPGQLSTGSAVPNQLVSEHLFTHDRTAYVVTQVEGALSLHPLSPEALDGESRAVDTVLRQRPLHLVPFSEFAQFIGFPATPGCDALAVAVGAWNEQLTGVQAREGVLLRAAWAEREFLVEPMPFSADTVVTQQLLRHDGHTWLGAVVAADDGYRFELLELGACGRTPHRVLSSRVRFPMEPYAVPPFFGPPITGLQLHARAIHEQELEWLAYDGTRLVSYKVQWPQRTVTETVTPVHDTQ